MRAVILLLLGSLSLAAWPQHTEHDGHNMRVAAAGVVMNENRDILPEGCSAISREHEFTVHAGRQYADDKHGMAYGLSMVEVRVAPCSRVTVDFVNDDQVRHQWMVHGLPRYLYPAGMFHIEAMAGQSQQGVFIVPPEDRTYLIHCDMSQHMEKGMRGQLVVGDGSGDLWAVNGISDAFYRASYQRNGSTLFIIIAAIAAFVATLWLANRRQ